MNITDCMFHEQLMLRVPALPFNHTPDMGQVIKNVFFRKAVRLASLSMYTEIKKGSLDFNNLPPKVKESLWRYRNRMMYRSTPFGLFATVSAARWDCQTRLLPGKMIVTIQPDFSACVAAIPEQDSKEGLLMPNGGIYKAGTAYRYLTAATTETGRRFSIRELSGSDALAQVLACLEEPLAYTALCDRLATAAELPRTECEALVTELFNIGFLVADTNDQINITGNCDWKRKKIPACGQNNPGYVIASRRLESCSVSRALQQKLSAGLDCLLRLNTGAPAAVEAFKKAFTDKFDRRRVPLAEALDPVTGISFDNTDDRSSDASLLQTAGFEAFRPLNGTNVRWSKAHSLLIDSWLSGSDRFAPIVLAADAVASLPLPEGDIPNSFAVIFRDCGSQVLIESAGGATATAVLGRFTIAHKELERAARELAGAEQQANPDVVFAEICHIEDYHTANIDRRQTLYDYEIPLCCGSVLDHQHQLPLSDLSLFVTDGILCLWSEKLQKRVIPRFSSAYNYTRSTLPVFRFLCMLQHEQLLSAYTFDLAAFFPGRCFYPRVVYKDAILCLATWILDAGAVDMVCGGGKDEPIAAVKALSARLQWPRFISVCEYDNTLLFDLENKEDIIHLAACFKAGKELLVREFVQEQLSAPLVTDGNNRYLHQLVAFPHHGNTIYKALKPPAIEDTVKRHYVPGSDWLYYKLYLHPSESNRVLVDKILPCLDLLKKQRMVQKWFFVRYRDRHYHLRLRIRLRPLDTGWAMTRMEKVLGSLAEAGTITGYSLDTYTRELERYSPALIGACEDFFCAGTALMTSWLSKVTFDESRYEYYYIGFKSVEWMLQRFGFGDSRAAILLMNLYQAALRQMEAAKADTIKGLAKRQFREINLRYTAMQHLEETVTKKLKQLRTAFIDSVEKLSEASCRRDALMRQQLLTDLMHMHLNRLFVDNSREQEAIFYYCLSRYITSRIAREQRNGLPSAADDAGR